MQRGRGFEGLQALRAVAALAIAFLHVADEAGTVAGRSDAAPYAVIKRLPLDAGVDLFFVISGFVMVWTCWTRFGGAHAVRGFVARRLLRILPLYWLLTAATVLVAAAEPSLLSDGLRDGWGYVAASFAFIPWRRDDGFVQPVLRLGWTLEYEMMFYALVAACLPFPRKAGVTAIVAGVAVLALLGWALPMPATPLGFWTDPIVLEFGLGALVAVLARRGWRGGLAGLAAFVLTVIAMTWLRIATPVLVRGVPAAMLVFCALSWRGVPRWLLALGDASYALYLVHPFPMRALQVAFVRLALPPAYAVPLYLAVTMTAGVVAALALHRMVERPILRWAQRRTARADGGAIRE